MKKNFWCWLAVDILFDLYAATVKGGCARHWAGATEMYSKKVGI